MKELILSRLTRLYGGSLEMDFGDMRKTLYTNQRGKSWEVVRGEYSLAYYNCCWRIVKGDLILYGCTEDEDFLEQIAGKYCLGTRLISCEFINGMTRRLWFSSGVSIDVFVCTVDMYDQPEYFTDFKGQEINFYNFLTSTEVY